MQTLADAFQHVDGIVILYIETDTQKLRIFRAALHPVIAWAIVQYPEIIELVDAVVAYSDSYPPGLE